MTDMSDHYVQAINIATHGAWFKIVNKLNCHAWTCCDSSVIVKYTLIASFTKFPVLELIEIVIARALYIVAIGSTYFVMITLSWFTLPRITDDYSIVEMRDRSGLLNLY